MVRSLTRVQAVEAVSMQVIFLRTCLSVIAPVVLLSSCGMKEYYQAQSDLYKLILEDRRAASTVELAASMTPLVKFDFVDSGGQMQTLQVNQQRQQTGGHKLDVPQLKTPLEQAFPWFDRTLSFGETFLPWLFGGKGGSGGTHYSFGDSATLYQTQGDGSPLSYSHDLTTTTHHAKEGK